MRHHALCFLWKFSILKCNFVTRGNIALSGTLPLPHFLSKNEQRADIYEQEFAILSLYIL